MFTVCGSQEYFDRFVSETPLPESVWASTTRVYQLNHRVDAGHVTILNMPDSDFLEVLKSAYDQRLVDVEAKAEFNPSSNYGSFSLEIILLDKVSGRADCLLRVLVEYSIMKSWELAGDNGIKYIMMVRLRNDCVKGNKCVQNQRYFGG